MSLPSARSKTSRHRVDVENEMMRRREREQRHQQTWGGQDEYYRHWEKANSKHDEWTSPRYYDANNKMLAERKAKQEKEELLEKRREKLRRLFEEEQRTHDIERMVMKNRHLTEERRKPDDIPTEVLKDVNLGLKLEEDDRRRHEAELNLYHKWRVNNPILREYERRYKTRDMKLSWLDQQIERRMQKEKEEEECRKILREREEYLKRQKEEDERAKREIQAKNDELKACLEKQMAEIRRKQEESDRLREQEEEERRCQLEMASFEEEYRQLGRKRAERECALYNVKQHNLKLKEKLKTVQDNLRDEQALIDKLKRFDLAERIENEHKKNEVRTAIVEFAKITREQQELEKLRQKHLEFCFESEAKSVYEKQTEIWKLEEASRNRLLNDVLETLKAQIEANIARNKEKQIESIKEREELVKQMEEYDKQMEELKKREDERQRAWRKHLDDDVKIKTVKKKQQENFKLKHLDEELEKIRKEEERLRREIVNLQKRQVPIKPSRSNIFLQ